MQSQEMEEIKEMFAALNKKMETIAKSLKSCQSHCYVDNPRVADPPGKWRGLGRALLALVRF